VDSIGIGEGEAVWPAIIEDLRKGVLKRQYRAGRLIDMKEVPFMKKELFENPECYHIETTRGCPYACDYCSVTEFYGNKYGHVRLKTSSVRLKTLRQDDFLCR